MNQRRFHHDLIRGLGSCVLAVQDNPERWRDEVLWACGRRIAFDPQCEGTHAEYLMEMIACYPDWQPFFDAVYPAVRRWYHHPGWKFDDCANLIVQMAASGYDSALQALETMHAELLLILRTATRRNIPCTFPAWEHYEHLTVARLSQSEEPTAFCRRVFCECGVLLRENPALSDWWAYNDWFRAAAEDRLGEGAYRALLNDGNPDIALYRKGVEEREREWEESRKNRPRSLRRQKRREKAPSERDRRQALQRIEAGETSGDAIALLVKNCRPEDGETLLGAVRKLKFRREEESDWHQVVLTVNEVADRDVPLPDDLFRYLYRENLCGWCRKSLVEQLIARGLLTPQLLAECLHDSNEDVISLAEMFEFQKNNP